MSISQKIVRNASIKSYEYGIIISEDNCFDYIYIFAKIQIPINLQ